MDTIADERESFTNVLSPSDTEASTLHEEIDINELEEHHEEDQPERTSPHSSCQGSYQFTQIGTSTPSADGQRSDSAVSRPLSKTRKESVSLQKYLTERQQDRGHFKRCIEDLMAHPEPKNDDDIDLFFKTMAATVRKFRPNLVTQTKASVFKVVTEMEIRNQQSIVSHNTGFTNIDYNENQSFYSPLSTSSPWTTPHSSHTEVSSDIASEVFVQALQSDNLE